MKNVLIAIATFCILVSQMLVVNAASLNTHPTGPGLSCSKPKQVTARSNPLTCTNHYEIIGYCTQGREGPGGNPYTQIEAGRAVYTVTSDWNGYSQKFTQHFSLSGGAYADSDKNKGTVVSHCSDDPMLNKVTCKTDPIEWTVWGKSTYHDPGLRGIFPLTDIGMSSAALRKQLLAHSTGPQITAPKEYQKFKGHHVLIVLKAALPCGIGPGAKTAALMIQKEKDVPSKAAGWVYETWVRFPSQKVRITNNGGIVKLSNLASGRWRVRAQVTSPIKGVAGDWREFTILGPKGISTVHRRAGALSGAFKREQYAGKQFGQQSQQQASRRENVGFGGKVRSGMNPQTSTPSMHTMSGHLNSTGTHKRYARAGSYKAHRTPVVAPDLKVLNDNESVDASCRNLAKFITLRETVINKGGPLATGHAHIYVKEHGGAHIYSQSVPVPALAHGARTTVTLRAGTQGSYRSKIPGRHVLSLNVVVNGKTTTTKVTRSFRPGSCQLPHSVGPHHTDMRMHIRLNPQPEPPSRR